MNSLPQGFFGTRADLLLDVVITSLVVVIPILAVSFRAARERRYVAHRNIQLALFWVLAAVLLVFEMNLQSRGGIFEMTRESRFAGTWILNTAVYGHMLFSISTAILWTVLIFASMIKFPNPPVPGPFSRAHRFWGRIAMIDILLTGITAVILYIVGFAL